MKFAVISDLHLDINKEYPVLDRLAEMAAAGRADGILIAGDITEHVSESISAMEQLEQKSGCRVFYVPGNHDLWSGDFSQLTTEEIYARYEADPRCLTGKPQILQGKDGVFALIGDVGWYDYSFANPRFSETELEQMNRDGRTWQDKLKNQWTADNLQRMKIQSGKLEMRLAQIRSRYGTDLPVIVMTHMIPVREFCVPEERTMWQYFNAYLGSAHLGELFERYRVSYSISGHVHYRKEAIHGATRYLCPCLGYHSEWKLYNEAHGTDLDWQLINTLHWIEI
ncbi:MAG: metallophosphoesterase [Lachnospiraceae bacterium]|nr:metallophosphoesterase [Lachnospiraceae bacterium]